MQLENENGPEYKAVVELLGLIRDGVIAHCSDSRESGVVFNRLLERKLVEYVLMQNWFDVQMLLLQELPETMDSAALMKLFLAKQDHS
jgi:hypothetical protein